MGSGLREEPDDAVVVGHVDLWATAGVQRHCAVPGFPLGEVKVLALGVEELQRAFSALAVEDLHRQTIGRSCEQVGVPIVSLSEGQHSIAGAGERRHEAVHIAGLPSERPGLGDLVSGDVVDVVGQSN